MGSKHLHLYRMASLSTVQNINISQNISPRTSEKSKFFLLFKSKSSSAALVKCTKLVLTLLRSFHGTKIKHFLKILSTKAIVNKTSHFLHSNHDMDG